MVSRNNLRLVSLDDGGARSFSQLEMMSVIMHRLRWEKFPNQPDKLMLPCEHFDLVGGSGTGGLICIMLVKLRMSVEEVSEEFAMIVEDVYKPNDLTPSKRTTRLKQHMENIMERRGLPLNLKLIEEPSNELCAGFVVTSTRTNAGSKICLRMYPVRSQPPSTITVIDAVLATCATQPTFSPVSSGIGYRRREYVGAGLGANPIREVITEASDLFGGNSTVASLLSLGTGNPGILSFPSDGDEVNIQQVMRDMANDREQRAQEIEQQVGRTGIYFRFSVEQGMQNDQIGRKDDLSWIVVHAESYLAEHETREKLDDFVQHIDAPITLITLDELNGGPRVSIPSAATLQMASAAIISSHEDAILAKLKPSNLECSPHVAECMEGTRQDVIIGISDWIVNIDAPNILWVKGHPGVGKSAIASSIVERLRVSTRLGSCFFFQREKAGVLTPNALWRTVAYDLARQYSTIRRSLVAALSADESITTSVNIEKLFCQLIHDPLVASHDIPRERLPVIIIDALDECGGLDGQHSEHRASLMRTLKHWSRLPNRFKLIVTSRDENDIERLFVNTTHQLIEIHVGQAVDSQSSEDVKKFLEHEFHQITAQYPRSLSSDWPGGQSIEKLTKRAAGLFIWAKTIVRFIARGEPRQKLSQILEGSGVGGMAALYSWVLNSSFPEPSERDINNFRTVLGTIILAKAPLQHSSLAHLLSIKSSTIEHICNGLESVMDSRDVLRIRHQSFVDFLIDSKECPPIFLVDRERESRNLTLACLQVMKNQLRFNICDLKSSYFRNSDIPGLDTQVMECISPWLSYSCSFWASHLAETGFNPEVYEFVQSFMRNQFLFWLEVLSLIKRVDLGSEILQLLIDWVRTSECDLEMAKNMQTFVTAFASVISQSVPHIYLSALPFSPSNSPISKQYLGQYPRTLVVQTGGSGDWPVTQNEPRGHKGPVHSVTVSPDGKRIASGSYDQTIRVWDIETGELIAGPFQGHESCVSTVAFSPDGRCIVSGSWDKTIRLWEARTGDIIAEPLKGHNGCVFCVVLSPDGRRIFSSSGDNTIRRWDADTGEILTGPFEGHNDLVFSIALSPDGKRIVSGSYDQTLRVWDAESGKVTAAPFGEHRGAVHSVTFSPDGRHIVSGSYDRTVLVWNAETGERVAGPFRGHEGGVNTVAFAPDGRHLISGSNDRTICVWDIETGEVVAGPFEGHSGDVNSVAFSPDGKRIVSGSVDRTIRVWDATSRIRDSSGDPSFTDTSKMDDGWILGSKSELLFWVPSAIRFGLWRPSNTAVIAPFVTTRLDLKLFVHGESWTHCKRA